MGRRDRAERRTAKWGNALQISNHVKERGWAVNWTKAKIHQVYELRRDGLSAREVGAILGMTEYAVRNGALRYGFRFSIPADELPQYWCFTCGMRPTEGRWVRCVECAEWVREQGSWFEDHTVAI